MRLTISTKVSTKSKILDEIEFWNATTTKLRLSAFVFKRSFTESPSTKMKIGIEASVDSFVSNINYDRQSR